MSTQPLTPPQQSRARLTSATPPLFNIDNFLKSLPPHAHLAPQHMPKCANPCQPAPISQIQRNEAKPAPAPRLLSSFTIQNSAFSSSPANSARQTVPNSANPHPKTSDPRKTNPPPPPLATKSKRPPRPLTANQILAATLLVAGRSSSAIAADLKINRHTLARWKGSIQFQNELRFQINARLAQQRPKPPAQPY